MLSEAEWQILEELKDNYPKDSELLSEKLGISKSKVRVTLSNLDSRRMADYATYMGNTDTVIITDHGIVALEDRSVYSLPSTNQNTENQNQDQMSAAFEKISLQNVAALISIILGILALYSIFG